MTKTNLRSCAISQTLFPQTSLSSAVQKLGFVQADPIRAPARAQDLILRHRVKNYHEGDLEKNASSLDLQEDYLYAYGFMTRQLNDLLHPKKKEKLSAFDKKVLEVVKQRPEITSKHLEEIFGKHTVTNWWNGKSRAVKLSLDELNYYGLVRVVRREKKLQGLFSESCGKT